MSWRADTESTHAEYPTERRAQLAADVLTMLGKGPVVVWDAGDEEGEPAEGPTACATGSPEPAEAPRMESLVRGDDDAAVPRSALERLWGSWDRKSKESA